MVNSNVRPIIIFDGNRLSMKENVEEDRHKNRVEAKRKAEDFKKQGNMAAAMRKCVEAVDITPDMANGFIKVLKAQKIEFYVAPYEADAQLCYLYKTGRVQAVITEDSDLLPYGADRCFFKMDRMGNGVEVDIKKLPEVTEMDFSKFTPESFLTLCILSGCDYLESIKGIGFKKAFKLVFEFGDDLNAILKKIRRDGKQLVPMTYEKDFEKALLTFKF